METIKKTFSRIGISYLAVSILTIVLGVILSSIISGISPELLSNVDFSTVLNAFTQFIIPLAIAYILLRKIKTTPIDKHALSIKSFVICICITLALIYIGDYIIGAGLNGIIGTFKHGGAVNPVNDLIVNQSIWLRLLESCILAPIVEELLYRKLLIDRTIKYGAGISILISALIFGLCHGNLTQAISAFIGGCFFAAIYVKTGKIIYTIILHMAANFFCLVVDNLMAFGNITIEMALIGVMAILIAITIYYIYKYRGKFKAIKDNISKLLKESLLNAGMVLYILYSLIFIISLLVV